jgi:hypothetical protein
MITANSDWSTRRRSSSDGKNDRARNRGIFSSRAPAVVVIVQARCPLRCPVQASVVRVCADHRGELGLDQRLGRWLGRLPDRVIDLGGFEYFQDLEQGRLA